LILESTGCQPVVAGNPGGNIFARPISQPVRRLPSLGKLPRPTGWQPVLPRKSNTPPKWPLQHVIYARQQMRDRLLRFVAHI
jgi:hypothetical protein